ncbi:hypothetical protein FE392_15080 [Xenorhabdus sp. 12]|uniref:Uncharacterized protein n=1 Tax=Xenorhabdus santafensis TaxID=2582833 RepID=A0ABU4SCV7_9GAMM|nr:hypothetical protein [Xenorhabdus sp. 12]MDX7988638.1 hypothetical protein [Xenorhabdus sp. 12]
MKIMIEAPDNANITKVLHTVNDYINRPGWEQNAVYRAHLPEDGITIKLKMTSAGNIIARVC